MTPAKLAATSRAHERAAAKRMWLAQAEQFAAECGYFQVCATCGASAADTKTFVINPKRDSK